MIPIIEKPASIYVASSWRNPTQPGIVHMLRRCGHEVYDFRNPGNGQKGFAWAEIDDGWELWSPSQYRDALNHPIAIKGHEADMRALRECDVLLYLLPCGRSASWEFGYAMGQGKRCYVLTLEERTEPELMFSGATLLVSLDEMFNAFALPGTDPYIATVPAATVRP